MTTTIVSSSFVKEKSLQLGIPEEILTCAIDVIYQSRNLVNALDNTVELDDYIYQAILKQIFERARRQAEIALEGTDQVLSTKAEKDLCVLSREELTTDAFYRAVLPLLAKVVTQEPILRLHADVASALILQLADLKRKHRATSLTEIVVRHYAAEMAVS